MLYKQRYRRVGVGLGGQLEQAPLFVSPLSHYCYRTLYGLKHAHMMLFQCMKVIHFSCLCLAWPANVSLLCSIDEIKGGGGRGRAGRWGAQKVVAFRRRMFLVFRETYSKDSRYDKCTNPALRYRQDLRDRDPTTRTWNSVQPEAPTRVTDCRKVVDSKIRRQLLVFS